MDIDKVIEKLIGIGLQIYKVNHSLIRIGNKCSIQFCGEFCVVRIARSKSRERTAETEYELMRILMRFGLITYEMLNPPIL
ncbi:MAG: hypothetical protein HUJ53_04520 [Holdemanella sp.]|nr:hypothetical protein [Holdemanella sp.]